MEYFIIGGLIIIFIALCIAFVFALIEVIIELFRIL